MTLHVKSCHLKKCQWNKNNILNSEQEYSSYLADKILYNRLLNRFAVQVNVS